MKNKCKIPDCPNPVKPGGKYCSRECTRKSLAVPRKYPPDAIQWIVDNIGKVSREGMIKHFNTTAVAFTRMLTKFRKDGADIRHLTPLEANRRSILTDDQRKWIGENFNSIPCHQMEQLLNIPKSIIKAFLDYQIKHKLLVRTTIHRTKSDNTMPKVRQGTRNTHSDRKPPVNEVRTRPMDQRLPNRKIETAACIKIHFHDKNKTTMSARDEEHVARIRKTYAQFEAFGSHLVYP